MAVMIMITYKGWIHNICTSILISV
jgi:hypothetical protein